jgi:hypothetical protein
MRLTFEPATGALLATVNRPIVERDPIAFTRDEGAGHPLAGPLLELTGITRVELSPGRIAVHCEPGADLEGLAAHVELVLHELLR